MTPEAPLLLRDPYLPWEGLTLPSGAPGGAQLASSQAAIPPVRTPEQVPAWGPTGGVAAFRSPGRSPWG